MACFIKYKEIFVKIITILLIVFLLFGCATTEGAELKREQDFSEWINSEPVSKVGGGIGFILCLGLLVLVLSGVIPVGSNPLK
jgi:hypothetical protein